MKNSTPSGQGSGGGVHTPPHPPVNPSLPFLSRNDEKWPNTRQIEIVCQNHILPPLGIENYANYINYAKLVNPKATRACCKVFVS
jgi:hypothetical protein